MNPEDIYRLAFILGFYALAAGLLVIAFIAALRIYRRSTMPQGRRNRIVATAYWEDMPPSTEVCYGRFEHPNSCQEIWSLEARIAAALAANVGKVPLRVIYQSSFHVAMSDQDVADAGWRALDSVPDPSA
jgi:hypothetical protein